MADGSCDEEGCWRGVARNVADAALLEECVLRLDWFWDSEYKGGIVGEAFVEGESAMS